MKVLTATYDEFTDMCDRLGEMIVKGGMEPDVIIGVLRGGGYVADILSRHFPTAKRADIKIQRNLSATKGNRLIRSAMRYIPPVILNIARMIESYCTRYRPTPSRDGDLSLPEDLTDYLSYAPRRVLIVDDAIDSGATMLAAVSSLRERYPHTDISTAAITVTTPHPAVDADFYIYHNNTLIRFPWAADSKHPMP